MSTKNIKTIAINSVNFAYLEKGAGPLVLCLHGYPDTAYTWSDTLTYLADKGYRAVAPFMRGYHPTDIPIDGDYSVLRLAKDALEMIEAFGETEAIVIGHDWGALAAYSAAALEPSRISKMVTLDMPHPASLSFNPRVIWKGRHILAYQMRQSSINHLKRNNFAHIDQIYRRWSPNWDFSAEETAPVKEAFAKPNRVEAALGYYWAFMAGLTGRNDAAKRGRELALAKISVPTLAIFGDWGAVTQKQVEQTRKAFTGHYEYTQLEGVGHFLHREEPEQFFALLAKFLKD